jgi:hypothetical protein
MEPDASNLKWNATILGWIEIVTQSLCPPREGRREKGVGERYNTYLPKRPILRPILEMEPDASNIAWNATIEGWTDNLDAMAAIPAYHHSQQPDLFATPMPVQVFFFFFFIIRIFS